MDSCYGISTVEGQQDFLGGGGGGGINNTLKGIAVKCIKSSLLEVGLQLT